nr:hypothetical protein [Candidatus Enterovibrio escacola]
MNNLDAVFAVFVDFDDFCQTFIPEWEKYLISSCIKERSLLASQLAK